MRSKKRVHFCPLFVSTVIFAASVFSRRICGNWGCTRAEDVVRGEETEVGKTGRVWLLQSHWQRVKWAQSGRMKWLECGGLRCAFLKCVFALDLCTTRDSLCERPTDASLKWASWQLNASQGQPPSCYQGQDLESWESEKSARVFFSILTQISKRHNLCF